MRHQMSNDKLFGKPPKTASRATLVHSTIIPSVDLTGFRPAAKKWRGKKKKPLSFLTQIDAPTCIPPHRLLMGVVPFFFFFGFFVFFFSNVPVFHSLIPIPSLSLSLSLFSPRDHPFLVHCPQHSYMIADSWWPAIWKVPLNRLVADPMVGKSRCNSPHSGLITSSLSHTPIHSSQILPSTTAPG